MRRRSVGQHQSMLAILVREEEENSFLLHQAHDKIACRLPVLSAVIPGLISLGKGVFKIGQAEIGKDFLDDIRNRLVLKNAAVGGSCQKPEKWDSSA